MKQSFALRTVCAVLLALSLSAGFAFAQEDPPPADALPLVVDVKPGSCANPVNVKSRGVIPIAVMGSEDFPIIEGLIPNVSFQITVGETTINWVPQYLRVAFDDVSDVTGDCETENPDDVLDLVLKVRTQELVKAMTGAGVKLANGQIVELALTLESEGIQAQGADNIVLNGVPKPKKPRKK